MAGDFNKPVVTDAYTSVIQSIKDLIADLAKGLDGTGTTNVPVNAIRWSSANNRFEKYNGSTWAALASTFAMNVSSVAGKVPGLAANNLLYLDGNAKVPLANMYRGAGSGLDADSVDGIDSSRFVYGDNTTATKFITSADAITGSGFYDGGSVTGFPDSSWWHMIQGRHTNEGNDYRFQLAFNFDTDNVKFRRFAGAAGVAGTAWRTIVHSGNAPGALNAQAAGAYGGMNITGANNGWAGFQFNSTSRYFMSSGGQTGEYDTGAGAWQWRWDNGTLAAGTIPWSRLSGVPAMSFLALTGGSLTGLLATNGNTQPFNSANDQTISVRSSGTGTAAVMSFHRPGAYAINMGLDTDNVFKIGGWSAGSPVFQLLMGGQLWTSNYGWLHEFFTRTVNAGYYLEGGGSGSNITIRHKPGFNGSGTPSSITVSEGHITAVSFNCNCNCGGG